MEELKPCPFCGEMPERGVLYVPVDGVREKIDIVTCQTDGCVMSHRNADAEEWNTRPTPDLGIDSKVVECSQCIEYDGMVCGGNCPMYIKKFYPMATHEKDDLLALTKGIEWVGMNKCIINPIISNVCDLGTKSCIAHHREVRRDATLEEVLEIGKRFIGMRVPYTINGINSDFQAALTINNGRLEVKEEE